ncbi:MAG TPA: sigma-54 dependent transcriptional regulator [Candidatus Wallbacteria bacterium]|mgnify:CR=1 FL=1|nr:sigma-54 dependent transcriptional regulator [Candidatus Wallbacteria bacterium]
MKYNILIVEDEKNQALLISRVLNRKGFDTVVVGSVEESLRAVTNARIDLVLTDFKLPDGDGFEVISGIKNINPDIIFVVMTAFGDVETAVKCLKGGAGDFLAKPVEPDELERIIFRMLQNKILVEEVTKLRRDAATRYSAENICGTSWRISAEIKKAVKIAPTDSNVLIFGESGTGKELFANLIHYNGERKDKPFIKVNCSAIPADLLESEFFGHMKGSFTGAYADKIGKFEAANGGTLFLDEIGELPMNLQAKLLRVIQEREIEPVGSNISRKIDVRLLFATNRDLKKAIGERQFREDLYYRVNTISLNLPALRERKEDIPLLLKYFINKYNVSLNRKVSDISSDALDRLVKYSWPGNIRELQNVVENTMVLMNEAETTIYMRNIPESVMLIASNVSGDGLKSGEGLPVESAICLELEKLYAEGKKVNLIDFIDGLEKVAVAWADKKMNGKKAELARFFDIDEKSVRNKIKKYDL